MSEASVVWIPVRQDGKFLFEYDPLNGRVRLRRWGRVFVVELRSIPAGTPQALPQLLDNLE